MASKDAKPADRASGRSKSPTQGSRRAASSVGSVVRPHARYIWGLAAVVAGLLVAGSVWVSASGPVGEGIDWVLAAGVGLVRAALPVGLVALGATAFYRARQIDVKTRTRPDSDVEGSPDADSRAAAAPRPDPDSMVRTTLGGLMLVVSASGVLHLARGRPGIGDPVDELGAAGGVLGVAVGGFLHAWTALWGSVLLLVFVALFGVIVITRGGAVSATAGALKVTWRLLGEIGRSVLALARLAWRGLRAAVVTLFSDIPETPARPHRYGHPDGAPFRVDPGSSEADTDDEPTPAEPEPSAATEIVAAPAGPAKVLATGASRKRRDGPSKWKLPAAKILTVTPSRQIDKAAVAERGQLLQATLGRFEVPTVLLEPVVGPTVTRFVLELDERVRVSKLESLRKDIALAMASPDVRILAPIPGRRAIGVEVPNLDRQIVRLGDVLRSPEARAAEHPLEVAIGRDINGQSMMMNLATTPHLLIAGATGAGKSSCLNSLITSVLMRSTPEDVRMILVDPKRVEMGQYDRVPHLLTAPVTDPRKAANALSWAVREMERRYDLLSETGFRDITGYNGAVDEDSLDPPPGARDADGEPLQYQRLPFVLLVVDELADLMMVAARDVEESIARIAQMARAVGIHLVIATQRPSVNIITGVIKANIPARLAFAVASLTDSRVILDQPGAERLVGQGDMLWLGPSSSTPHRIQGCWVTEDEVRAVVGHWVDQAPDFDDDPSVSTDGSPGGESGGPLQPGPDLGGAPIMPTSITEAPPMEDDGGDELLDAAMALVVETQLGSTSMLQRRLRVGFARAGRIMDLLEQRGVVGPSTGSKAREVLITPEEFEARQAG